MDSQRLLGPNGLVYALEEADDITRIYWGGLSFYAYNRNDAFEKKFGIALLANLGVAYQTICDLFEINRHTVRKTLAVYLESGAEGLRKYHQGPETVEEAVHDFVIAEYARLNGMRGYQNKILEAIEKKAAEGVFRGAISRSTLQKILQAHKDATKRKQEDEKRAAELKKQDEEAGRGRREAEKDRTADGQHEFEQEGQDICVDHGGAAAIIPLLGQLGLEGALPEEPEHKDRLYSIGELAVSYAALNAAGQVEVEQDFKLAAGYQMGGIIGRKRLPCLSVYRQRIPLAVGKMDMQAVMLESARRAAGIFGPTRVAYIDGHFMPYYGETETLYGYNTQRRMAMHGREYVYVHEQTGIPIFASLSDGYRKMQHYVESLDGAIRDIYGVGTKEILEVFDRGGYSKEFCIGICDKILFVCWRSDARVTPDIPADEWVDASVEHQGNTTLDVRWKQMEAWERTRTMEADGKHATFREIWIRSGQKVSPAVSNDFDRPLPELVAALTGRWGNQENMFKDLKDHGIDRIHSYQSEPYSEEYLYSRGLEDREEGVRHEIGNPEIRKLNRELKRLRIEKKKLDGNVLASEKAQKGDVTALRKKLAGLVRRIDNRVKKRDELPKTVLMMDRIEENNVLRLCDGKKMFFDWLKMNAIWATNMLVEVVKPFYKDLRDVNKFVLSILQGRTYVCKTGDALDVAFPPQRSKNGGQALEALCEFLNEKEPFALGLSFRTIRFRVGEKH